MTFFVRDILLNTATVKAITGVTSETLFCILWGLLTTMFTVVSLRKNKALVFILVNVALTFFLLAWGQHDVNATKAAGYFAFAAGGGALYLSAAEIFKIELGISLPGLAPIRWI